MAVLLLHAPMPRQEAHPQQSAWFLLLAPLSKDGKTQDFRRPLVEWSHVASFDTAERCEKYRNEFTNRGIKDKDFYPVEEWKDLRESAIYAGTKCLPLELLKEVIPGWK